MRVLHLTWLMSPRGGGIPYGVAEIAAAQREASIDAIIAALEDPATPAIASRAPQVHCRHLGPLALGWSPALARAIRGTAPDVLHLHGLFTWTSALSRRFALQNRGPVVVSPHGMLDAWALANSAWKKRLFRWWIEDKNLSRAACLHALTEAEAESIRALGLRNPLAVIPNGVALVDGAGVDREAFRVANPEVRDRRILLFLGRLHPKKGLLHLVEAIATTTATSGKGWALVVAGPDQRGHRHVVAQRAMELGVADRVIFTGALHGRAKDEAFAAASAFVLSSFSEGLPVAVLEAMAWGLPVVVSRQCNVDVEICGAGLVSEPDAESVRLQLDRLFTMDDGQRAQMGEAGRREVERRYTWRRVSGELVSVYRWVLGKGERPACVREHS